MTTSYTVTRDQVISSALRKLQVLELGTSPDTDTLNNAVVVLNLLLKQWATDGLKLWTIDELSMPLQANTNLYVLGPASTTGITNAITGALSYDKPLKLVQAWLRNTSVSPNIDTPMQILSKQEFNILGSKYSTGTANSIFLDPRASTSNLYVYLTPNTTTVSTYSLHIVVQRMMSDIVNGTDIPDLPMEWMQALVWGLADQLAMEYSLPSNFRQEISMKAETYRQQLSGWDVESTSSFFTPDLRARAQ